jgi:hypothetical protein
MNVEESFKNVMGRAMTQDEVTRYLKFQKEFEVPDTDPTWIMFVYFEFYLRIYEQIPLSMRKESEVILNQIKSASSAVLKETTKNIDLVVAEGKKQIAEESERGKTALAKALDATLPRKIDEAVKEVVDKIEKKKSNSFESVLIFMMGVFAAGVIAGVSWWAGTKGFFNS